MAQPQQIPQGMPQGVPSQGQPVNPEPETLRNLMVNYIPTTIDELQLRQLFEQYGPIETVKIVCDRETRQSRGYGFVKYRQAASSAMAIQELNGYPILNKRLKVALANHDQQQQQRQPQQQAPYNAYSAAQANPYAAQLQAQQAMMLQYQQYQQYLMQQAQGQGQSGQSQQYQGQRQQ
ncbi:RNA-binding protein, putative [Bodo saltans]|uniref:RNA-binding protein, putative n=1 Tax=Bodo saltans TaxID=75058 RepID=A0A0S4IKV8_BODSA|nr:RNA-binding protein, putative [Bodo saltans]|eukprot:CUF15250.1 RNA-binding protein, putative [Bodo saltans]